MASWRIEFDANPAIKTEAKNPAISMNASFRVDSPEPGPETKNTGFSLSFRLSFTSSG